jgi:DNA mismatch endonuclease Vsr
MADACPNQRGGFITKQPVATTCRRSAATNTKPEILVRKFLHAQSYRYTLYNITLPGKPDIVLHKYKTEIFVHACLPVGRVVSGMDITSANTLLCQKQEAGCTGVIKVVNLRSCRIK